MAAQRLGSLDECRGCAECRDFRGPARSGTDPAGMRGSPPLPPPQPRCPCGRLALPGYAYCLRCAQLIARQEARWETQVKFELGELA